MGSHNPSPNVKILCNFEPQIWRESITSRDARDVIHFWLFWAKFWPEKVTPCDGCFLLIELQDHEERGLSLRGVAVMTETVMIA